MPDARHESTVERTIDLRDATPAGDPRVAGIADALDRAHDEIEGGPEFTDLARIVIALIDRAPRPGDRVARLRLMDAGLNFAHRIRAEIQTTSANAARFTLPLWVDSGRSVRLAVPVEDPQHGSEVLQVIAPLDELLTTVGHALGEALIQERISDALGEADRGA